jgi:hypothetical protein
MAATSPAMTMKLENANCFSGLSLGRIFHRAAGFRDSNLIFREPLAKAADPYRCSLLPRLRAGVSAQHRSAWTHELELRPFKEPFSGRDDR